LRKSPLDAPVPAVRLQLENVKNNVASNHAAREFTHFVIRLLLLYWQLLYFQQSNGNPYAVGDTQPNYTPVRILFVSNPIRSLCPSTASQSRPKANDPTRQSSCLSNEVK
jgi:hypothetical protein